jgi:hypothetical protein
LTRIFSPVVAENNIDVLTGLKLNFSTQNVRSLNIATKNLITDQKLLAITKNGTDVIFLCDLRIQSNKQIVACQEITKRLYLMGYKFIHNSPTSSRGVGILIKKRLP